MRTLFVITSAVLCIGLEPAAAQSVQNPLYELESDEICEPGSKQLQTDGKVVKKEVVLAHLLKTYPITPSAAEFYLPRGEFLKSKLVPGTQAACKEKPNLCDYRTPEFADEVRFNKQDNALRFRNSLLRLFEASYSGGTTRFLIVRNSANFTAENGLSADYRPLKRAEEDDAVIGRFIEGKEDFRVVCRSELGDAPFQIAGSQVAAQTSNSENDLGLLTTFERSSAWIQPSRSIADGLGKKRGEGNIKGQLQLVRDRTQFTASKPKGLSVGTELNLDLSQDQSSVTINGALGYRFNYSDYDKKDLKASGTSASLIPFVSIDQKPADIATLDEDNPFFASGEPNVGKRKIASATLFAGVRGEFEHIPAGCSTKSKISHCSEKWMRGVRLPERKFIATFGTFTDNYSDQQGLQLEGGYSPGFIRVIPGYRRAARLDLGTGEIKNYPGDPLGFFDTFSSGFFEWETTFIGDRVEYARAPRNRDTLDPGDRIENADAFRLGIDASFDVRWNNVFSIASDKAGLMLGFDYKFRESLEEGQRSLQDFTSEIQITDVLNENYSFGLTYRVGRDILTQEKFDLVSLKAETSF